MRKKIYSMLALLCLTVSGAWAQEETLLTTIESTADDNVGFTSGSKTFDNIATVTFSGNVKNDGDGWGWYSDPERTLTVTAAEGYTITRVKFYTDEGSAFDEEAPFEAILVSTDYNIAKVNGTSIGSWGVNKIEVYGYAGTPEPAGYTVSMPQDTPDAEKWTARAGTDGTYQQLPLEGVAAGTAVSVKYSGTKKVKSVKAVKKAQATITVTWNNDDITGTGMGTSFTKDGVTITAGIINFNDKTFTGGGTFTTTLGNFTKIEVTTGNWDVYGTGWSGSGQSGTWTGNASSVPFSGGFMGENMGNTKFVFTIEPTNAAAPTLAETLTTAGMTVKVNYNYNGENYCLFVSNGDGTYTFQSGEGYAGGDKCAKALVVEDGKLVFKQNFFATIDDNFDMFGFSVTFDTSNNTYSQWLGPAAESSFNPSFISVEVNGTQIAVTQQ